jgi:hypothetical protein
MCKPEKYFLAYRQGGNDNIDDEAHCRFEERWTLTVDDPEGWAIPTLRKRLLNSTKLGTSTPNLRSVDCVTGDLSNNTRLIDTD